MDKIIFIGFCVIVYAICKAIQDTLQFHFHRSVFRNMGKWWNPAKSWMLKYKDGRPAKGERFLGSTTVFVSFTSAWHTFGLIRNLQLSIIAAIGSGYWWLIGLHLVLIFVFHIFFERILSK